MILTVHPLTADRWTEFIATDPELARLAPATDQGWSDTAAASLSGLIAYDGGQPVAFVQACPTGNLPTTHGASASNTPDDLPLAHKWALPFFYTTPSRRRQGLMSALARAACYVAQGKGAFWVDAAAIRPGKRMDTRAAAGGITSGLARVGFREIAARGKDHVLMRWTAVNG